MRSFDLGYMDVSALPWALMLAVMLIVPLTGLLLLMAFGGWIAAQMQRLHQWFLLCRLRRSRRKPRVF